MSLLTLSFAAASLVALASPGAPKDDAAIKRVLTNLETAWNKGDAELWGAQFAKAADFTVWSGLRIRGREAIVAGHEGLFRGPYKGTKLRLKLDGIRYIRPDVAVVLTQAFRSDPGGPFLKDPEMKQTYVLSKHGSAWSIDAFQNTKIQEWKAPTPR